MQSLIRSLEKKRLEQLIEEQHYLHEEHNKIFFEHFKNSENLIFLVDTDSGDILSVNEKAIEFLGYSKNELLKRGLQHLFPGEISSILQDKKDEGFHSCTKQVNRSGNLVELEVVSLPVEIIHTRRVLIVVMRELGQVKTDQEDMGFKETYDHVKAAVPACLYLTDKDLRLIYYCGQMTENQGIFKKGSYGKLIMEVLADREVVLDIESIHKKALKGNSLTFDYNYLEKHFQVTVRPLKNSSGEITGTFGLIHPGKVQKTPVQNPVGSNNNPGVVDSKVFEFDNEFLNASDNLPHVPIDAFLKSIYKASPTAIGVIKNRIIQYANPRFTALTGYNLDDLVGKNVRFLYDSEQEYERVGSQIQEQLKTKGEANTESRWRIKDGSFIDVRIGYAPVDMDPENELFTFTILDITGRKTAIRELTERENILQEQNSLIRKHSNEIENQNTAISKINNELADSNESLQKINTQLYLSESKFRTLFDDMGDALVIHDANGVILEVNKETCRRLGCEKETLIQTNIDEIVSNQFRLKNKQIIDLIVTDGVALFESAHLTRDKKIIPVEICARLIYYDNKPAVLNISRDITERKTTELLLKQKEQEFKVLVENAADVIFRFNRDMQYVYVNPAIEKEMGIPAREVIGKNSEQIKIFDGFTDEIERGAFKAFDSCKEQIVEFSLNRGKSTKYFQCRIVPELNNDENVETVLGITREISSFKEAEKILIQAKEKAEEADCLKSAFLANMSHEIRTPMNAILGFSELLGDPHTSPEQRKDYIKLIQGSGENLIHIIDDIIDIAKIEAGQIKINKESFSLNHMMKSLLAIHQETLLGKGKKDVELVLEIDEGTKDIFIISDENRVKQVLSNLIVNAIKFTETGFIKFGYNPQIENNSVLFHVQDTGIGIKKDHLDKVFDRFRQLDEGHTRQYGGTGLGLTISKNMVTLLGGKMWLTSDYGKGSTFYFTLPYKEGIPSATPPPPGQVDETSSGNPGWHDYTVLIAEDEETNYIYLEELLEQTGVKIIRAWNGQEAIDLYHDNKVDLILMDIKMPIRNGIDAAREIKEHDPKISIIAQTAYAMLEDKFFYTNQGFFDDYLTKPIKPKVLIEIMGKYLHPK